LLFEEVNNSRDAINNVSTYGGGEIKMSNKEEDSKLSFCKSIYNRGRHLKYLLGLPVLLILGLMGMTCSNNGSGGREMFRNPPEISSRNGVLHANFDVRFSKFKIGDKKVTSSVYNGSFIPPTLRVNPGDLIRLNLKNNIDQMTNLHYHGMNVTPISPSDDIFIMVTPTGEFEYEVPIPDGHSPGTYYYHAHAFGLTEYQIMSGLSGALIVEGELDPFPQLQGIPELIMDLKDIQIDSDGRVPMDIDPSGPTNITLNGQVNPVIKIRPGETQLWRIANIGADHYYPLQLEGLTMYEIARDGNLHNQIVEIPPGETLLLPVSSRVDVLVQGGPKGEYEFIDLPFNTGPQGDTYDGATLATLVSEGPSQEPIDLSTLVFPQLENLCDQPIPQNQKRTIVFSETADGDTFFINGKVFNPDIVDTTVKIGTLEEWTIQNTSQELHVFHIHQTDFQVCEVNGVKKPFIGYQDTVNLPYMGEDPNKQGPGEVKIVINFRNPIIEGKFVYHCHIAEHEDNGMMAVIEAVP
jgi:FtsP/CotA-like multicopper oxidase with cupredoxin domain